MYKASFMLWLSTVLLTGFYYAGRQGHSEWELILAIPIVLFFIGLIFGVLTFIDEMDSA